jgi:hypothetical protein
MAHLVMNVVGVAVALGNGENVRRGASGANAERGSESVNGEEVVTATATIGDTDRPAVKAGLFNSPDKHPPTQIVRQTI